MKEAEKALIILEELDEYMSVNWNHESWYIKGIMNGLHKLNLMESGEIENDCDSSK